jgi:hypothetical protein
VRKNIPFFILLKGIQVVFFFNAKFFNRNKSAVLNDSTRLTHNSTLSVNISITRNSRTTAASTTNGLITRMSSFKQLNEKTSADLNRIWRDNQMEDGACILTISSYGNRDMTLNWFVSLKKNNCTKFIIFCFDLKLVDFLTARGYGNNSIRIPLEWANFNVSLDPQDFRKGQFDLMMKSRVEIWYQLLMMNKTFLSSDTDLVFLSKHVYDHIKYAYRFSLVEAIFSQDISKRRVHFNTGFFYVTPTNFVKTIFSEVLMEMERIPNGQSSTDQITLNRIILKKWLYDKRIGVSDNSLYAMGLYYFHQKQDLSMNIQLLTAHANYIISNKLKRKKLKERGLWYLDEMNEEKIN